MHTKRPEHLTNLSIGDGVRFEFEIFAKNLPDDSLRITNSEDFKLETSWPAGAIKLLGFLAMQGVSFNTVGTRLVVSPMMMGTSDEDTTANVLRVLDSDPWINEGMGHGYAFAFASDLAWCLSEFMKGRIKYVG